jgi:hypothetical protein
MRIFVTGASGWIGAAVVPELLRAAHEVVGLARSEVSAERLEAAGAIVKRGDVDDPDGLAALFALSLAGTGVRSSVLRLTPTVHGNGDNGFMASLVGIARERGVAGYVVTAPTGGRPCTGPTRPLGPHRRREGPSRLGLARGRPGGDGFSRHRSGHGPPPRRFHSIGGALRRRRTLRPPRPPRGPGQPRHLRRHPGPARLGAGRAQPARGPRAGLLLSPARF